MRKLGVLILSVFMAIGFSSMACASEWKEIKAQELKAMMDQGSVLVINPLSIIEFNDLHIDGSVGIPMNLLKEKLPQDKNQAMAFYCLGRK